MPSYDEIERYSDEKIGDILRHGDPAERNAVGDFLVRKYQRRLERRLAEKLSSDLVELTVSEVWTQFYSTIQRHGVKKSIEGLLFTIANNVRADAVELEERERQIEYDIPLDELATSSVSYDEVLIDNEQRQFLLEIPYRPLVLAPCQRVMWVLRGHYGYQSRVVSRLMGKRVGTVDTHFSVARSRVANHVMTEDYDLSLRAEDLSIATRTGVPAAKAVMVEQFAERSFPKLSPDELDPLGLSAEELKSHYDALLVVPRWYEEGSEIKVGKLGLLLVQRTDRKEWLKMVERGLKRPDKEDYFFPEACMVEVDVEDSYIHLRPQTLLQLMPDISPMGPTDTYLSTHRPMGLLPVLFGFFWEDALTPDELEERWPFLPTEEL